MTVALATPRLIVGDAEMLDRRARALAEPFAEETDAGGARRVVVFRLAVTACAVDAAAVERAVVALAHPFAVPLASGEERTVAFVEERPVAVVDLAGFAWGLARSAGELEGRPALLLRTGEAPVAVVVDGPLELAEERLAATAAEADVTAGVRIAGRLGGGAALVDAGWLTQWARKAASA